MKAKNYGLAVLCLAAGVALGAWAMRFYFDRTLGSWNPTMRFLAQMDSDLDLSNEQSRKVAAILDEQKDRMEELRKQWKFQVETLDRQGENQIVQALDPAQTDRFMKLHDSIHGRMDRLLWSTSGPTAVAIASGEK